MENGERCIKDLYAGEKVEYGKNYWKYEWLMIDASHIKVHPYAFHPQKNRIEQREYDKYLYRMCHLIENTFLYIKRWSGIATRYAKTLDAFIAAIQVRCIALWLKKLT